MRPAKYAEDQSSIFIGGDINGSCDDVEDASGRTSLSNTTDDLSTCDHEESRVAVHFKCWFRKSLWLILHSPSHAQMTT